MLDRVQPSTPGVIAARFDEPRQEACVDPQSEAIAIEDIAAAAERSGFRTTESRNPCPG